MERRKFVQNTSLVGGILIVAPSLISSTLEGTKNQESSLVILHTNDIHSNQDSFSDQHPLFPQQGGIEKRAQYIRTVKETNKNVLLVDAGDFMNGTNYFHEFQGELDVKCISELKYDAVTLGNHDFNLGLDHLAKILGKATFHVVIANYEIDHAELKSRIQSNVIIQKGEYKIGIFGLGIDLTDLLPVTVTEKINYLDPIITAQTQINDLKAQNCDYIVCLSHLGLSYETQQVSDVILAQSTHGLDAIIGGHTHTFVSEGLNVENLKGENVVISQAGYGGLVMGRMDFTENNVVSGIIELI